MATDEAARIVSRPVVIDVIRQLCRDYRKATGRLPGILIGVGGTAMMLHGLRGQSADVDLFTKDQGVPQVAGMVQAQVDGQPIDIDVTSNPYLWGEVPVTDIEDDAQVVEQVEIEPGEFVSIAAISKETLFILKACSGRDKDMPDVVRLASRTSPEAVVRRLATISDRTDADLSEQVYKVLATLQENHGWSLLPEWFSGISGKTLTQWQPVLESLTGDPDFAERPAPAAGRRMKFG